MENTRINRSQKSPAMPPISPRLLRNKSRSSPAAIMLPENNSSAGNTSDRSIGGRSTGEMKLRSKKNEENVNPLANREFSFLTMAKRSKSISATSPSAWALSPGRSSWVQAKPPEKVSGGGVGGFLKYFRPKKVSQIQENELHKFRVLNNRLLQMRFINLKAEAAIKDSKLSAEDRLFTAWLRNLRLRNSIVEKKIKVEELKSEIRVYKITYPQISLLNRWEKMERRNEESVGSLIRVLSGLSVKLPLIQGAKGDVNSFHQAISVAEKTMSSIQTITMNDLFQPMEKMLYVVTERLSMFKEEEEWLEKMEKSIYFVSALLGEERSLRVQLMQLPIQFKDDT